MQSSQTLEGKRWKGGPVRHHQRCFWLVLFRVGVGRASPLRRSCAAGSSPKVSVSVTVIPLVTYSYGTVGRDASSPFVRPAV